MFNIAKLNAAFHEGCADRCPARTRTGAQDILPAKLLAWKTKCSGKAGPRKTASSFALGCDVQ